MTTYADFLLEIGTAELPAKPLRRFARELADLLQNEFTQHKLSYAKVKYFATPRRLAVFVQDLQASQADYFAEKKGPHIANAFDANGQPTQAALGFARSCGVSVEALEKSSEGFLYYRYQIQGQTSAALLPQIVQSAVSKLTIPKPMRWGKDNIQFIRPVHWVVLLLGEELINAEILGCKTDRISYGHRFLKPAGLPIPYPLAYENILLEQGMVVPDFDKRRALIKQQIDKLAEGINATAVVDDDLLDEVTGLVEWPNALLANFNAEFLQVPSEALISAMKTHQKSFPVLDTEKHMLPHFITIANLKSNDETQVVIGNQRVMQARLSDAAFFYHSDCKLRLESHLDDLKPIIFQAKLGTLYDKSQRVAKLAGYIGEVIANKELSYRAGLLCKTDLVTDMVNEFPELQGVMGFYYANHDGEQHEVAKAIRDHYMPRFAGDSLPATSVGDAVALADRLDTLIGIFGIQQLPTGDKDPFALRRAALGVLRILIEHQYELNLQILLQQALAGYQQPLSNKNVVVQVQEFILERLRAWYADQEIASDTLAAVLEGSTGNDVPLDVHRRVQAVHEFRKLPEAKALAAANKRAGNILAKTNQTENFLTNDPWTLIKTELFSDDAERSLYDEIATIIASPQQVSTSQNNYTLLLNSLSHLREPIDRFFDGVMVMCDDENIRLNRLALLASLRKLFLRIADISKLQP
jgi:glycyl-tRNA synthetase beta chain